MKQQTQINKTEWKEMGVLDCLEREASNNKLKLQQKEFLEKGKYPIVDQGEKFIAGYTNDKSKIYNGRLPVVIFGDHTRILKFINFPFALGADGVKIFVVDKRINSKYFYYAIQNLKIKSLGYSRHYKLLKTKKISLPFSNGSPDLKEQERIVKILEKAEALKLKREDADKKTKEYLKSIFYEMFLKDKNNLEEKRLDEICDFIDYRGKTPKKTESGIKLITAKNVKKGYIDNNPEEFIAESDYEKWMTRGFPKTGDVLFTTEAPLGNVAVLGHFDKIALAQRIITLQCKEEIDSYYLMYFLLTPNFQNKLKKDTTGSTVSGIRSKEFKNIQIPLPPLPLQKKFSRIVEHVEKLKEKQKKSKEEIDNLFNSLMQKAFRGEL